MTVAQDLFRRPLVMFAVSLILGILSLRYRIVFLIFCVWFIYFLLKAVSGIRLTISIFLIIFFIIGSYRTSYFLNKTTLDTSYERNSSNIVVEGYVYKISITQEKFLLYLQNVTIFDSNTDNKYSAKNDYDIIVVLSNEDKDISINKICQVGDKVLAKGSLYPCEASRNPGQFDEKSYYLARGIDGKLYVDEFTVLEKSESFMDKVSDFMVQVSMKLRQGIVNCFPEKEAGILTAMLTGEKGELDEDVRELYSKIGIAHILSISGLHITLLGMGLYKILLLITKRLKFSSIVVLVIMYLYGVMTGFSVSTQRAVIMLYCMLIARMILYTYDGQSAAALAGMIILINNPYMLYDSGFQMSFVAVFSLFSANEIMNRLELESKLIRYLFPCVWVQIGTLPVILSNYYCYNLLSIVANLIILPLMSIVLLSGIFSGIFGAFNYLMLGRIFAGPGYYILNFFQWISEEISRISGIEIITGIPHILSICIYYFFYFLAVYLAYRIKLSSNQNFISRNNASGFIDKNRGLKIRNTVFRVYFIFNLAVITFCTVILCCNYQRFDVECDFLDMGQGACVFVRLNDKNILYDGGSANIKNVGKYRIIPFLKSKGVRHLDYIVVSHTDEDHVSGIKELLSEKEIDIGKVIVSVKTSENDTFLQLCKELGYSISFVKMGDLLDDADLQVISPHENVNYTDTNAASVVLLVKKNNFEILLTGDSDSFAEAVYLKNVSDEVDVLQVAHHGSKYSTSKELLDISTPLISIVSCAKHNSYGHPAEATLDRLNSVGSDIYYTFENGMISVGYKDGNIFIEQWIYN